jgi:hypothetical protein
MIVMMCRWLCLRRWGMERPSRATKIKDDDDEDEVDDVGEGNQELQQQAGPSTDAQAHDAAVPHWLPHRTMYTSFIYAPNLIAPAHTFGVHVLGTTPGLPGASTLPHHAADTDAAEDEDEDLMLAETDNEALEAELCAEALLDAADACAAVAYEAGLWRELRGGRQGGTGGPSRRARMRERERK